MESNPYFWEDRVKSSHMFEIQSSLLSSVISLKRIVILLLVRPGLESAF